MRLGQKTRVRRGASTSRWVDYDTHELLNMISELEDERRWARLREGIWLALLIHILLLSADHLDSALPLPCPAGHRSL